MLTHNLQAELTSFIGRDDELRDIERLVTQRRLVTLTGVGGCGKTRLAGQVCNRLGGHWPDGVWWIDLGSLSDPGLVVRTVASALGVLVEPKGDPLQALAAQLRSRHLMLCLDTCEHLLDVVSTLTDRLLRECPRVSVLATSREPLGVAGETVWRVPSLKVDEAVRLFADRATLVAPGFAARTHQVEVRSVCTRVDGIPLAIELAAAWVRALAPIQIASGLDESFRLLEGGPRGALPRHQALTASMEWSHALLEDAEQVVFRRLGVFAGGFSLGAVRAVCVDDDRADDALATLGRLVDKSLVVVRQTATETRYRLLDTVRQYAQERLHISGEEDSVRDRHLDFYLAYVERAEPELDRDQDAWRRALAADNDNIVAALEWGLSAPVTGGDRARRLAAAMSRQWFIRGQAHEGIAFLERAVDLAPEDRSALQGRLLCGRAMLGMISARIQMAAESAQRGLEIAAETGDEPTRARCLVMSAYREFYFDMERCHRLATEAAELGVAADDAFSRDWGMVQAAYALTTRDRHEDAVLLARQGYEQSSPRGDRFVAAFGRGVELLDAMNTGRVREAVAIAEHMRQIVAPLDDYFAVGTNTGLAAHAIALAGDRDGARRILDPVVRSVESAPDVDVVGFQVTYGQIELWDGAIEEAARWFERGIRFTAPGADNWTSIRCLPGLAEAYARAGRTGEAADLAERAVAEAARFDAPYPLSEALDVQALLVRDSDPGRARNLHHEALAVRTGSGLRTFYADGLEALAYIDATEGHGHEAARMLAASDAAREEIGYPRPPVDVPGYEQAVTAARSALGEEEFAAAWSEGAGLSLDDAVSAVTRGRGSQTRSSRGWSSLTPTELDVVRLVVEGLSNPDIGGRLFISRATVKTHLSHIYAKLDIANRTELASLAAGRIDDA